MEVPSTSNNNPIDPKSPSSDEPNPEPPCVTHVIMQHTFQPKRRWSISEYKTRIDCKNNFDSKSHTPSTSITKTI
jgi:hypothetical protein